MPIRTAPTKNISDIRKFTDRNGGVVLNWLPSVGGDFENTFTLKGKNPGSKAPSDGEINVLTVFSGTDKDKEGNGPFNENSGVVLDLNILRYYLALYCLRNLPYSFEGVSEVLNYNADNNLFTDSIRLFLEQQQTGKGYYPATIGLTSDIVRYYRDTKLIDEIKSDKDISSLLDYASSSADYKKNVVGVLGRVTYDSIVKNTLYSLLLQNGIINSNDVRNGQIWSDEAAKLNPDEFGFFIDPSGGTYSRAFPVVCVYTKSSSGKKLQDLLAKSNEFISSKFLRNVTDKQLVEVITSKKTGKPVGGEKNFIEKPNSLSGDSFYCVIYDFTKIIVLDTNVLNDYTLDLLKIALSFLTTKLLTFNNKEDFTIYFQKIKKFIEGSFGENIEDNDFSVAFKNKHAEECAYSLNKNTTDFKSKLDSKFKAELKLVVSSLEDSYSKILDIFDQQTAKGNNRNFQFKKYPENKDYPIYLHFDNFYNLLAVTSENLSEQGSIQTYDESYPFDLAQYDIGYSHGDLITDFFKDPETLPKIPQGATVPDYSFSPTIATTSDIVLITDVFLRQTYNILETKKDGLVYENDKNQRIDNILKADSIKLLELIKSRTQKDLNKNDYFIISSNKIYLKKDIIKKLSLDDLTLSFGSVKETKIKFQTISHLLFLNLEELKKQKLTIDDFKNRIYYPLLNQTTPPPPPPPSQTPKTKPIPKKNNDFLINNIISSELNCYEDIANSFDKAINAEKTNDKVYYAFQSLVNIGLPILLVVAAGIIAKRLSEQKKPGEEINPSLLECINKDDDKLKKNIIGHRDVSSGKAIEDLLTQAYSKLQLLPAIAYFTTFDAEKELKRRLVKYVINLILSKLSKQLKKSIQAIIDMCNSDSYLTSFLSMAQPNASTSGKKLGTATASGYPAGTSPTVYFPQIIADINILIDQSKIQTRSAVYQLFREKYEVKIQDSEISEFFTHISTAVDAGQLASLLKGTSAIETRGTLVSYIRNYSNKAFYDFINDSGSVSVLFEFLSLYIDYNLCYGVISDSLVNYSANVCDPSDSKYDENVLKFNFDAINDEIADLTKALNEICEAKTPLDIDILLGGPSLLSDRIKKILNIGIIENSKTLDLYSTLLISQLDDKQKIEDPIQKNIQSGIISPKSFAYPNLPNKAIFSNLLDIYDKILSEYVIHKDENGVVDNASLEFLIYINKIIYDNIANLAQTLGVSVVNTEGQIAFFKNVYKSGEKNKKFIESFKQKLDNAGNIGLKTNIASFDGYLRKLEQFNKDGTKITI